jgi:uncharacterized oxidoreductase
LKRDIALLTQPEEFVVVTGASRGIGAQLTAKLIAQGRSVIAVGRFSTGLEQLEQRYGDKIHTYALDLGDPAACQNFATHIAETYSIVGLINNAAIQNEGPLELQSAAEIDREIRINLTAPAILCARLLPHLPRGRGFIVNVSSGLGLAPKRDAAVYCATKAALRNLTRALENQLSADLKIAMIDVVLPLVDTDMTTGRGSGKISAEDAARAIMSAIGTRQKVKWVGKSALLNIVNRLSPALSGVIMRKM